MDDLRGKRFGKLIVLEDSGERKRRNIVWKCICDCGNITMVKADNLKTGKTKSCGCFRRDIAKKKMYKHGESYGDLRSRLYETWTNMKTRCCNSNNKAYKSYGKREITVCDEWKNNYRAFKFWAILNGYQDNLTIDRIDNDGNYEPNNCQFITQSENLKKMWANNERRK